MGCPAWHPSGGNPRASLLKEASTALEKYRGKLLFLSVTGITRQRCQGCGLSWCHRCVRRHSGAILAMAVSLVLLVIPLPISGPRPLRASDKTRRYFR
jgi:hypothetical protein